MASFGHWLSVRALAPLLIPPIYIAIVSLAERRWGQSWSGRLTAIPTQTTTVILLVAVTESPNLAGAVAAGALLGVMSLSAFAVGYALVSTRASWPGSVAAGIAAFLALGLGLVYVHGDPVVDAIVAAAAVGASLVVLRRIPASSNGGRRRTIGLPVRMGLALALVISVAISVPYLGPIAAGTLGVFPIITAPMAVLNQEESGPGASRRYLEGLEWGLLGGIVFFLALSLALGPLGVPLAFAVSIPLLVATLLIVFLVPERLHRGRPATT
jgi:hypothetical protein